MTWTNHSDGLRKGRTVFIAGLCSRWRRRFTGRLNDVLKKNQVRETAASSTLYKLHLRTGEFNHVAALQRGRLTYQGAAVDIRPLGSFYVG